MCNATLTTKTKEVLTVTIAQLINWMSTHVEHNTGDVINAANNIAALADALREVVTYATISIESINIVAERYENWEGNDESTNNMFYALLDSLLLQAQQIKKN